MKKIILIYVTCSSEKEAEKIGELLLKKNLCGCVNVIPKMNSMYLWPVGSKRIEKSSESILIIKSVEENYRKIQSEVLKIHSYENPCILSISVKDIFQKYYQWLVNEME
jgi:periplasmic divalent cation tolerance protein